MWAVVRSRRGQARSPHANTLTLNHSLQSRERLVAVIRVPWTVVLLYSGCNWVWGQGARAFCSL